MASTLEPAAALDPGTLTSLYLGALGLEADDRRLAAAEAVLSVGRLGLRPGELLHLHAGWIDWERGELRVPERDPCACELCWERARVAQRDGDGRPLADIVGAEAWAGTPRAVPFGWAPRLTGVLATAVDAWEYLDCSAERVRALLAEAADRATGVDPETVDVAALRASAAAFFADAGFDAPRIADLMGIDVETAAAFTAQRPGQTRAHLYQAFDAEPPPAAGQGSAYGLLTDPEPLANEPFDPTDFGAGWRTDRAAAASDESDGSPRPAIIPEGIETETEVRERDAGRPGDADDEPEPEDESPAVTDLRDLVTEPVRLDLTTRFAGSALLDGRPSGGRVLFGASEVVIGAHGGGEIQAAVVVPYDAVRDVAVGWAPDRLASIFEETIGLAAEPDGERQRIVIEIPEGEREALTRALFSGVLGEFRAVVRHPAVIENQVTDAEPVRRRLAVRDGRLDVRGAEEPNPTIALADVIGVERDRERVAPEVHRGVRVDHIQPDGRTLGTFLAPADERDGRLLERFLVADVHDRERRAAAADLSGDEHEVLDALETNPGRRDLAKLLGMDRNELSAVLESLSAAGFLHAAEDGVRLSGMGRLRLGEAVDA